MSNRYTNITPSRFNPLSMEEIFTVPLAKQRSHDKAQSELDALGLFDVKHLQKDEGLTTDYINDYTSKIDQEIDAINKGGINNQSIGRVKALARERDKWLKQGEGKKVQDNYNSYIANKEQLDKLYEKGDISADKYQLGLQSALDSYKGVAEGGAYNPFAAVADTDYVKEALTLAKSIPLQKQEEFLVENGYQLTPDGSMYVHGETGKEFTKPGAIADLVIHGLGNNSNVMADLKQRQELGLFGDRSVEDVMVDLSKTMEQDLSVNNTSLDSKLTGNKAYNKDSNNIGGLVYNERGFEKVEVFDKDTMKRLDKVGDIIKSRTVSAGTGAPGTQEGGYEKTLDNSYIKPEDLKKLQTLTTSMFESDSFVTKLGIKNTNLNDPDTFIKVRDYINKFQDHAFGVNVVKPNSSDGNLNSLPINDSKMAKASTDFVKQEIITGGIKLYDKKTGELQKPNDLAGYGKYEYSGYYPADNLITNLKGANQATMVSPGEVIAYDKDGLNPKVFYSSRPSSDMDKPAFKAAKMIKDIKVGMTQNLGVKTSIPVPQELSNSMQNFNYEFDIDKNEYTIQFKGLDTDGETMVDFSYGNMSPSALQSFINGLYGVN